MILGALLFDVGITTETAAELQRRAFKRDPRNAGKPFSGGLFGLARNINYGGHILWKMGNALAAGGWVWGVLVGAGYLYDFATRGVPVLDGYCEEKVCGVSFFPLLFLLFACCVQGKKDAKLTSRCSIFTPITSSFFFFWK